MLRHLLSTSIAIVLTIAGITRSVLGQEVYRVDISVSGGNQSGQDWANAISSLQSALLQANEGDQIWVAEGTYAVASQTAYFELEDNVTIYGGFDGLPTNEQAPSERNIHKFETILSGDVAGDDDPNDPFNVTLTDDNAFHVVECDSGVQDAWIDGFTITGGFAVSTDVGTGKQNGGGMRCVTSDKVIIANIIFKHNLSIKNGGGLYYKNGDPDSALVNCSFIGNETDASGGGAYIEGPIEQVTNCSFAANIAFSEGGGLANFSGTKIIVSQCSFSKNDAGAADTRRGSGLYCAPGNLPEATTDDSTADIRNCIFWENGLGTSDTWLSTTETTDTFQANHCWDGCCGGRYLLSRSQPQYVYDKEQEMQRALDVRVSVPLIVITDCIFTTCEYAAAHILYDVGETWFELFDASATLGGTDSYAIRGAIGKIRWRDGSMTNDADKAIMRVWLTTDGIIENYDFVGGQLWLGGSSSSGPPFYGFSNVKFRSCYFEFFDDTELPCEPPLCDCSNPCNDLDPCDDDGDPACDDPPAIRITQNTNHVTFEDCDFVHFGTQETFVNFENPGAGVMAHDITFIDCTYSYNGGAPGALDYSELDVPPFPNAQDIKFITTVPDLQHREAKQFYAPNNYEGSSVKSSNIEGLIPYSDPLNPATTFDTAGSGNIGNLSSHNPQFADPYSNLRLADCSPCIDRGNNDLIPGELGTGITGDAANLDYDLDFDEVLPDDGTLAPRVVDNPNVSDMGLPPNDPPYVDMGAYEIPGCATPADLFPTCRPLCGFGDGFVGAGDLGQLLSKWGPCAGCCEDIAPVGSPNGRVDAGDLAELLTQWGNAPEDCGGEGFGDGLGGGDDAGDASDQDWPEVEMTEELYDWIMSTPLDEIWDWLWSLLEG